MRNNREKLKLAAKILGAVLFAILVFYCLFVVVDTQFDQKTADLFEEKFTFYQGYYLENGELTYLPRIDWQKIKELVFWCGVGIICLFGIAITAAVLLSRRKAEKRAIHAVGNDLREYLSGSDESQLPASGKYGEMLACVADFKSRMLHDERVLKDETSKKNDLIAYLAHDLKTPLTSVVGYLSLMEEAPEMPAEQKAKYVHIALEKALRLESLINEFFEITRYNLHEIVLEKEPIDLPYMLMQMTDEFYPILREHGNRICLEAQEGLTILADPIKMARVFNNILKNAIAYSSRDSEILLKAEQKETCISISFRNEGKTIPKQKLQSIFEKFYRLDAARSTNSGGAGLGLAIAKEIVLLHGGAIHAESEDGVTAFTVELPNG